MAVEFKRYRFNVDEYQRMGEVGIFHEDDRVELIDGEIVEMSPIGPVHNATVARINKTFELRFGDVALVWVQSSLRLDRYDEPLPDVLLLRPRDDFYASALPTAADVLLAVEVADSSLSEDLRGKAPRYARLGVPETWVADLRNQAVHIHREPLSDGYRVIQTLRRGDRVAPLAFPDRDLDIADLLGA